MSNQLLLHILMILITTFTTNAATTYMVGDTSGWDISTNLDSWSDNKVFQPGDVLVFQYSSSNSVSEVTKPNFDACNTTNAINTFSNGNTTVTLTKPGTRYFISGNRLYCLGGMKLQVNVQGNNQVSTSSENAPESSSESGRPSPSSKSSNPAGVVPTSSGFAWTGSNSVLLGFMCSVLWLVL